MAHHHIPDQIPAKFLPRSSKANLAFGAMVAVGAVGFFLAHGQNDTAAWGSYVANWLFFTSVAMGAVMFSGATMIVRAKWNWSLRRISMAFVAFLPISILLLLPMLGFLRENYFPWIEMMGYDPIVQKKAAYLNIPFLLARNVVGPLVLFGMALYFVYTALRPDMGRLSEDGLDAGQRSWRSRLMAGWRGQEAEEVHADRLLGKLGPTMALLYATVMSFIVYDFAMSLDPHWFSTLFGGWFFMAGFWGGIAATAFTAVAVRRGDADLARHIGIQQRHDIGKLTFAFTVFWTYLFFSQYIVIWYGKLPWEQSWMVARAGEGWGRYSLMVVLLCFVVPFASLIGRKAKLNPTWLQTVTAIILFGLWNERYFLVAPSLFPAYDSSLMFYHLLTGIGFLGLFLFSVRWFLSTFPVLQIWQPIQPDEVTEQEVPARAA